MHFAVLGASGATGRQLTRQALDRGHHVRAIERNPANIHYGSDMWLRTMAGDVSNLSSLVEALDGADAVLSGLGLTTGSTVNVLTAGARAVTTAAPIRIIWLGAFGTGTTAALAGLVGRFIVQMTLGPEVFDKVTADNIILAAGGTVIHAGPLTNRHLRPNQLVRVDALPHALLPQPISRATLAASMLDEAELDRHSGKLVVARRV